MGWMLLLLPPRLTEPALWGWGTSCPRLRARPSLCRSCSRSTWQRGKRAREWRQKRWQAPGGVPPKRGTAQTLQDL